MKNAIVLLMITVCTHCLYGQNVGIGTTSPMARLHVADSSVVFTANAMLPDVAGATPVSGAGSRMMWYVDKAAFRAGTVQPDDIFGDGSTNWDAPNIGYYSFAAGFNAKANGYGAVAMGYQTKAASDFTTALGYVSVASGAWSTAIGFQSKSKGLYSTAIGYGNDATGNFSATAIGFNNWAKGDASTSMGYRTRATGAIATSMGDSTVARAYASLSVGRFNDSIIGSSLNTWIATDPLLIVGNGSSDAARSNALVILKNGNTGIGVNNPGSNKLQVAGNTQTTSLQVSNGTVFSKMQGGSIAVGNSGSVIKTATIIFPASFATVPRVVCTIVNDDPLQTNANDTWAVSIRNISTTQCVVNIVRVDFNGGWASQPHLSWFAFTN
jgi:hypothetical protein